MSYKLAICDDIEKDRDYISSLVQVWAERERLDTPFNVLDEPTAICACLSLLSRLRHAHIAVNRQRSKTNNFAYKITLHTFEYSIVQIAI